MIVRMMTSSYYVIITADYKRLGKRRINTEERRHGGSLGPWSALWDRCSADSECRDTREYETVAQGARAARVTPPCAE
jgi:hypothetical protein